ncbi:MAG TPA: MDR family oxidoreductase [Burkholderiales bacterium]
MHGILLTRPESGFHAELTEIDESALPEGDVTVKVDYSTINYKDGLAITNKSPVVRKWPMVPGIDFAGTVSASSHPRHQVGDKVLLNGYGVGETHWGGLAQVARVKGDWLIPLPASLSAKQAMAVGTAGYTAMLCVMALKRNGVTREQGEILVTGASGGVGSVAIAILATQGYKVVASTGKLDHADYLKHLGAAEVIDRAELSATGKPLQKERWAGVVDSVGSHTLVNACAQTRYGGTVAACGLAAGFDFPATVMPFILRGITLAGVDSVMAPMALRTQAWQHIATELPAAVLEVIATELPLKGALNAAHDIVSGRVRGRLVVDVNR